jgi:hypothetical protein
MYYVVHLKVCAPQKYFCAHAPHNFLTSVAHHTVVRHKILAFCGACSQMRYRNFVGPTWDPVHHMGEGNYVAHVPTCVTERWTYVAHIRICARIPCGGPDLTVAGHISMAQMLICAT